MEGVGFGKRVNNFRSERLRGECPTKRGSMLPNPSDKEVKI